MTDMLVKLYDLPPEPPSLPRGIVVRRALGPERHQVLAWVVREFSRGWADECGLAFGRLPIACFIAHRGHQLAGFCVYDATARGMAGPIGVAPRFQGQGVGRHLILTTLNDMAARGYAYAVVGWVGPASFFARTVGAIPIPDSGPGIYRDLLSAAPSRPGPDSSE
ncbi:MAG: GNAT family N-acetyltransferase [Desulfobacterales bacterium]|jgi:GNAT superfamily N-acetyltransferase